MNGRHLLAATLALGAMSTLACKKDSGDAGDKEPAPVINAQTIVVAPQAFTETFGAIGTVVPRAGHVATLSAPSAGRVLTVLVTTGQTVQQGQPLVELDPAPFQAALQAANAAYAAAERANERQQRLANEGIVPRKDAESAAADMAKARADVVSAQRAADQATLRSPIGGVVTKMTATLGASVDAAQPLVEVSDVSAVDVLLNVTPADAGRVQPGAKVAIGAGASATGEPLGIGAVLDVSGTVDSTARGVAIRVQAPTTRRPLKIGETVFGAIAIGTRPNAIVVPNEAIVPDGDAFKVFVVDDKSIAHEREVKIGAKNATSTEITDGLKAGERIVTFGAYGVSDSAKIAPLKPDSAKADTAEKDEK